MVYPESRTAEIRTTGGTIRGCVTGGVFRFLGIPYACAERFLPPRPFKWKGVRDAFVPGDSCPTADRGKRRTDYVPLLQGTVPVSESEDCLNLNIWTPDPDSGNRLPVIVWIPGGGFHSGSANETPAADGENISRYGDIVFVSVNHRQSILGFLDLSPFGRERYGNSANLGLMDLVTALEWIRENISLFGGDPGNVTLAGHSGGGCKQWAIMQTPAADGLFHKCFMESAFSDNMVFPQKEHSGYEIVHGMLSELGLEDRDVRELETMDYGRLLDAYLPVYRRMSEEYMRDGVYRYVGKTVLANGYFAGYPFEYGLRRQAEKIPCVTGSALGESGWHKDVILNKRDLSAPQREERLKEVYGDRTGEAVERWNRAYPGKDPLDLIYLETMFRNRCLDWCRLKYELGTPVWNYVFALENPIFGGLPAHHGSEIPYMLRNNCRMPKRAGGLKRN